MLLRARRFNLPSAETLSKVQQEVDQFFGRYLQDPVANGNSVRTWRPPVAMWEEAGKVFLDVELPGVSKDRIDVTVHNGMMRISGERAKPEGDRNYWVNERTFGPFDQTITLPEDVDADSIDAQFSDGMLHIVLTKRPEAQPRKVTLRD